MHYKVPEMTLIRPKQSRHFDRQLYLWVFVALIASARRVANLGAFVTAPGLSERPGTKTARPTQCRT